MEGAGDSSVASKENNPAKTLARDERPSLSSSQDKSDPIQTTQGHEELGFPSPTPKQPVRSLTPLLSSSAHPKTQRHLNLRQLGVQVRGHNSPRHHRTRKLVEVFAVQMIATTLTELKRISGVILLKGSGKNFVIYENRGDERYPQFNSEGYFTLIGPQHGVEVKDTLVLYPWLIDTIYAVCDRSKGITLWKEDAPLPRTDQAIRKGFRTKLGVMEIDFAVYKDGVEAYIEIFLLEMRAGLLPLEKPLEVYGTVKATNSVVIGQCNTRSTLLDTMASQQGFKLSSFPSGEAEISVPMTRNIMAIPRESTLRVDVDLSLDKSVAVVVGSASFDVSSRKYGSVEEKIVLGAHAMVKVKVRWSI